MIEEVINVLIIFCFLKLTPHNN